MAVDSSVGHRSGCSESLSLSRHFNSSFPTSTPDSSRYDLLSSSRAEVSGIDGTDLYNVVFNKWVACLVSQDDFTPGIIFPLHRSPGKLSSPRPVAAGGDGSGARSCQRRQHVDRPLYTVIYRCWKRDCKFDSHDIDRKSTYPGIVIMRYVEGDLTYGEYDPLYSNDSMYIQQPIRCMVDIIRL